MPRNWSRVWRRVAVLSGDLGTFEAARGVAVDCVTSGDPCQPNSVAGMMTTDGCSTTCCESPRKCGLVISSERTCRGTRTGSSPRLSLHRMGYRVAAGVFSAAEVGAAIDGSGCSSWPTAQAHGAQGGRMNSPVQISPTGMTSRTDSRDRWRISESGGVLADRPGERVD